MNVAGVWLGRLGVTELGDLLAAARSAEPTYDHVGSVLQPDRWPDRSAYVRSRQLGRGDDDFGAAVARLRAWAPQRALGAAVHPAGAPIAEGTTLVVELRLGPLGVVVPNRIVTVIDEPRRFGFAYGTLPGHAESGEEGFLVALADDGTVTGTVAVDARPAGLPARLVAPFIVALQRRAVDRYLGALVVSG